MPAIPGLQVPAGAAYLLPRPILPGGADQMAHSLSAMSPATVVRRISRG